MNNELSIREKEELESLRSQIFEIDRGIIELLANRFEFVKKVGKIKKENNIPPLDQTQWNKVIETRKDTARGLNVSENLIEEILESIHKESLRLEK